MIPDDWHYEDGLPLAWIVESSMAIQCCCPNCDYYDGGYKETIIMVNVEKKPRKCPKCNTDFLALAS
jgi:hypothetical protein